MNHTMFEVIENPNINFEEIVKSDHSDSEYEIV